MQSFWNFTSEKELLLGLNSSPGDYNALTNKEAEDVEADKKSEFDIVEELQIFRK